MDSAELGLMKWMKPKVEGKFCPVRKGLKWTLFLLGVILVLVVGFLWLVTSCSVVEFGKVE